MELELIENKCPMRQGQLIYRKSEYSFDFLPSQGGGYDILIADLTITFDVSTLCAIQVWGYHPYLHWIQQKLWVPQTKEGSIQFLKNTMIDDEIAERIEGTYEWPTYYDRTSGWVCIGNCECKIDDIVLEFATNIVAVINQRKLKSLWLRPLIVA